MIGRGRKKGARLLPAAAVQRMNLSSMPPAIRLIFRLLASVLCKIPWRAKHIPKLTVLQPRVLVLNALSKTSESAPLPRNFDYYLFVPALCIDSNVRATTTERSSAKRGVQNYRTDNEAPPFTLKCPTWSWLGLAYTI